MVANRPYGSLLKAAWCSYARLAKDTDYRGRSTADGLFLRCAEGNGETTKHCQHWRHENTSKDRPKLQARSVESYRGALLTGGCRSRQSCHRSSAAFRTCSCLVQAQKSLALFLPLCLCLGSRFLLRNCPTRRCSRRFGISARGQSRISRRWRNQLSLGNAPDTGGDEIDTQS